MRSKQGYKNALEKMAGTELFRDESIVFVRGLSRFPILFSPGDFKGSCENIEAGS